MSYRNSYAAISEINSWTVDDVQTVLCNNGLESACAAFRKREIDGENLLNLTEGKLALWKRDLTLIEIRKLARFVNDLTTSPERYLLLKHGRQNGNHQELPALPPLPPRPHTPGSDTGSWDTDFEDDHDPQSSEDVYSEPPEDNHPPLPAKPSGGFQYSNKPSPSPGRKLATTNAPNSGFLQSNKSSASLDRNQTMTNPSLHTPNGGFLYSNKSTSSLGRNVAKTAQSFNTPNGGFLHSNKSSAVSDRNHTTTNQSFNTPNGGFLHSNKSSAPSDRNLTTTDPSFNAPNSGFLHSNRQVMTNNQSFNSPSGGNVYTRSPSLTANQNTNVSRDPVKPPIPNRPPPMATRNGGCPSANASALFGLPKPPTPPTLEKLISTLNIVETNQPADEYYEEDEYTSIEEGVGINPQSIGFPPSQVVPTPQQPISLPPRKITPSEQPRIELPPRNLIPVQQLPVELPPRNIIPPKQSPMEYQPRKLSSTQQTPLELPQRKLTPSEQPTLEQIRAASPNPYPKFSFGAPRSRPPAPQPAISLDEPHFNNIPAGIPNHMSALANNSKYLKGLKPAMQLPASNHGSNQSLDKMAYITTSNEYLNSSVSEVDGSDSNWEEEYEIIEDKPQQTEYYMQPVAAPPPPMLMPKPCRQASVAPEIVTPSSRPPSPPRKKSFPDDVTQDLADKLRAEMKKRQLSNSSTNEAEREKSPMPELQKPTPTGLGPRPLPPTPDAARKPGGPVKMNPHRNSRNLTQMPWYHNVDRKRAEEMLSNGEDGKFIVRPSTQTQNPLTLTLWYGKRLYNISIRQRPDQRYALGTEKAKEQSFTSVEELVQHYHGEELVLHSKGERTGKTLLTLSPPRQSS